MNDRRTVALLSTGGSIGFVGSDPLDLYDYAEGEKLLAAEELIALVPELEDIQVLAAGCLSLRSSRVTPTHWLALLTAIEELQSAHSDLAGIVVTHGTATLEETAYFLHLTSKVSIPVVLVGAQRPPTGLSSDAPMNLLAAVRVAAARDAVDRGVLVVLNDEIHSARDVTKSANYRLQAFQSRATGPIGFVDPDAVVTFYRRDDRLHAPHTDFDVRQATSLPRVDIAYAYAGADGACISGFVRSGARGIVVAALAPGLVPPDLNAALIEANDAGVVIVISSRAGAGRVLPTRSIRRGRFIAADDLSPQKARILTMAGLTVTDDPDALQELFRRY